MMLVGDLTLRRELAGMTNELKNSGRKDLVTVACKDWHGRFVQELREGPNEDLVLGKYVELLQGILKDSMPIPSSLEEKSYLGSDGFVYGYKALCCYIRDMPQDRKGRSPCRLDQPELFFVEDNPHPIVKMCVVWLRHRKGEIAPNESLISRFAELEASNIIPKLPIKDLAMRQERWRKLSIRNAAPDNVVEVANKANEIAIGNQGDVNKANLAFAGIIALQEAGQARRKAQLELLRVNGEEDLRFVDKEAIALKEQIDSLANGNEANEESIKDLKKRVSQGETDTTRLEREINNTTEAIAKREAKGDSKGFMSIVGVVASIVATALLPPGTFVAAGANGARAGIIIPI